MSSKIKVLLISLALLIALGLISLVIFISHQASLFQKGSGIPLNQAINEVVKGIKENPIQTNKQDTLVFLILGTNEIPNRPVPPITDTILAGSVNFKTGHVGLFSIPRDVWSTAYKTKIDALYTYGFQRYPSQPEKFTDEVVGQMANLNFDKTVVITPDSFVKIIDALGGIDINVTHPFVDNLYPRMDVDVTRVTDPKLLYETIEFKEGLQHMDGETALKYVRSRHAEGIEGSDIARSQRQREVISTIASELKNPKFYTDLEKLGKLYKIYNDYFSRYLSVSDAVSLARQIYPIKNKITITEGSPTIFPDDPKGSIYHPNFSPLGDGQWVFLIRDQKKFQEEIQNVILP